MREETYYIAVFKSKNHAIQVFSLLEKLGYKKFKLIPSPTSIGVGCNYSIKFKDINDLNIIKQQIYGTNIRIEAVYMHEKKNRIKNISYII
jgi:hypothetical protein